VFAIWLSWANDSEQSLPEFVVKQPRISELGSGNRHIRVTYWGWMMCGGNTLNYLQHRPNSMMIKTARRYNMWQHVFGELGGPC
jgi:hypothetical protein